MNILYIGAGFVGTCSAAVAVNSGHSAFVYDIDKTRVAKLSSSDRDTIESCLFERGLGDLLTQHANKVRFSADYAEVKHFLDTCDAVFLCLPTPEVGETGESDMRFYDAALQELSFALRARNGSEQSKYIVVVNKSTVPISTADRTAALLKKDGVINVGVASNPEFLVEGKAIQGSLKPDRIVIGATDIKDKEVLRQIYQRFYSDPTVQYIETSPAEAEAGKLLANFYLFAKLALCFDVVGRVSETFPGIKFEQLRKILTSDDRIGSWGFYNSLYAGGSCLLKDTRSLAYQLQSKNQDVTMVNDVYNANERQLELFMSRANEAVGDWTGKRVAILGLSFKRDTNDTRNSASRKLVSFVEEKSVESLVLFDPAGMEQLQKDLPATEKRIYAQNERDAILSADVIILATDWPQFRGVADLLLEQKRPNTVILDGRRLLQHRYNDLRAAGYTVVAVGSPIQ